MKTLKNIFIFIFALLAFSRAFASACPLGSQDQGLTLQRVMKNFGKYTAKPDRLVTQALGSLENIKDQDLEQAALDLEIVQACISAVLESQDPALRPQGMEDVFIKLIGRFGDLIKNYRQEFIQLRAQSANSRDFSRVAEAKKQMSDFVDEAHSHF
jgi:hypothetical protein